MQILLLGYLSNSCGDGEGACKDVNATNTIVNESSHSVQIKMYADSVLVVIFETSIPKLDSVTFSGKCTQGWKCGGGCQIGWDEYEVKYTSIVFDNEKELIYPDGGCISKFQTYELSDGAICRDRAIYEFEFHFAITEEDYQNAEPL